MEKRLRGRRGGAGARARPLCWAVAPAAPRQHTEAVELGHGAQVVGDTERPCCPACGASHFPRSKPIFPPGPWPAGRVWTQGHKPASLLDPFPWADGEKARGFASKAPAPSRVRPAEDPGMQARPGCGPTDGHSAGAPGPSTLGAIPLVFFINR